MSSSILKYGQIIRIRSYEFSNTFLTSKSYTDQNLYFQVYSKDSFVLPNSDIINVDNYRESLYEVLPTSSFEINDQMNSQKVEAKKAESAPRAKTEEEQFKAMCVDKRGNGISFGEKVIFRHLDSQYYMYGSFDCASSGIGAFKIQLKKELSEKVIFRLLSFRTYEKDGDQISLYAPFKIYHCETQCYVSYCYDRLFLDSGAPVNSLSHPLQVHDKDFPVEPPKIKEAYFKESQEEFVGEAVLGLALNQTQNQNQISEQAVAGPAPGEFLPSTGRYLIINENIPKRTFKLVTHNEFQQKVNKQRIRNHDIVYFIHTEKDQYVCPSNYTSQIFLKKRLGESDLTDIFDGLWEIQEVKTLEDKPDEIALGKSKSPSRKEPRDTGKKLGNLNTLIAPTMNLNMSYLTATVGNPIIQGQIRAGFVSNTEPQQDGEKGKRRQKYFLRHLASGRIMYVSNDMTRVQLQFYLEKKPLLLLESIDTKLEDGALVQFTYKTRDNSGNKSKFTKRFLSVVSSNEAPRPGLEEAIQEEDAALQASIEEQGQESQNDIEAAYNSQFQKSKLGLTADSSEHGFRIYKIAQEAKQLCLFVLSSQEILSKFTRLIGEYITLEELLEQLNVFLLNNVISVLKNLIGFIYDCEYSKIAESGNNPNSKRQRIFDQLGMIQLVTRMLEQINRADFPSEQAQIFRGRNQTRERLLGLEQLNKNSQYRKVRTVYELGYKLLQSVAASNDLMKLRISKYMNKYLFHIMEKANRTVYRSIQEFLDGNYLALEQIHVSYIENLIAHLDQEDPDPADLYFLSRLCLCRERTVPKNQVAVFANFYQRNGEEPSSKFNMEQRLSANKFRFREDQQKMQILSRITPSFEPQYRTLSELFQQCNLMKNQGGYDPDKNHWSYFMQYLNLLADICVQRNQSPLEYIKKSLPLKTLVAFLHESTVKKNLLFQPFIRLVHHAFVETADYQEINRITKVKEWDGLGNFNIPKAKKPIPRDIEKTMTLIFDYIKRVNKKPFERKKLAEDSSRDEPETIDFNVEDLGRLGNVKTFLQILKSTLNLGFWQQIDEMKRMVPYLLKLMRFDIEYARKVLEDTMQTDKKNNQNQHLTPQEYQQRVYGRIKQQVKLNKPNIVLLVECKILAAKILNIIIDYQYNVRVSMITKYFKDVMEIDVDLSKYNYDKIKFINTWKNHNQYEEFAPNNQKEGYLLIEDLWMDKVQEILNQRDIFSECLEERINPALVFFQAFVYSNTQLTNLTLQLINRISNQRQQILRTFKDIIFVAGGHLKNLAIRGVQTTRSVLLSLTTQTIRDQNVSNNLLWVLMREDSVYDKMGVVQELASLTMSMMKNYANPSPKNASDFYSANDLFPFYDIFLHNDNPNGDSDGSYLIISEKDQNLILNQNLIKSQDHHLLIIDFIKIMSQLPTPSLLPMRALHAAYNFLTVLVWNNIEIKKQLENIMRIAECHLSYNVGCIDFFKQMYTNNKKLVKKSQIKPIIQSVIGHANGLKVSSYQKSKLMDFLRIAVIFDDEGYDINQNMVMELISQYQVSSNNQIVYLKAEEQTPFSLSNVISNSYGMWISQYGKEYRRATFQFNQGLTISPQLCYVAIFFQVFSALIENQNVVNIGKASNMHPIQFLLQILNKSERCWMVIRHLRAYLNRLYYFDGRSKDTSLFKMFTHTDLSIIREELKGIVELICNFPEHNNIRIANPIRYSYLSSYVFLSLEEILHSLDLFFKGSPNCRDYESFLNLELSQQEPNGDRYELTFNIIEIIEMLQYLLKTIDGRYINKYMTRVSKRLRSFLGNSPFKVINLYMDSSKRDTLRNIEENKISSDDIPFKKSYNFHDGKGFWRHLIDWNSFKDQEIQREKDLSKVQKRVEPNPNESKEAGEQRKRDYMLDVLFLGNIDKKIQKAKAKPKEKAIEVGKDMKEEGGKSQTALPKNLTTSQSVRFRVKNQRFSSSESKNIIINQRRKKLVKFLQVNDAFHYFSREEVKSSLYDIFASLDTTSKLQYNNILIVGNAEVIKSIVKMNELDPQSIKSQYKLLLIRLLTNFIQRESPIFQEDIQKWYFAKEQDAECIRKPQNFLHECNVASFLSSLVVNDLRFNIEMANAILMLGISLLLGKNTSNQNELFKLIREDDRNLLLSQVNLLVKDCGASISAHLAGGKQREYNLTGVNFSDTYDFYIDSQKVMKRQFVYQPETVLEQREFDQKVVNMQYAFVFLKNLCEGNIEIKEYIRQQVTADEERKLKSQSINFLALSVGELKRMFLKFNIEIIKVPFSIIDFIYEVTQIPCLDNQLFLCRSSLFSDFAALELTIDGLIEKKELEASPRNILIIFSLYSSNIKNVISCLQGNIADIFESLSTEVLCRYFVRVLSFYIRYLPTVQNTGEIKQGAHLQRLLDKKKLHESFYLDMFQTTSVIVKLEKKTPVKEFTGRIAYNIKKANITEIFQLLKRNLLGIQIRMDGAQEGTSHYQTQFFPRHKVFRYLSRTTRTTIMQEVDRSTQRDKIIGLLGTKQAMNEEIEYNYMLDNEFTIFRMPFSITNAKIQNYFQTGLYLGTIICFLMAWFSAVVYFPYEDAIQYDLGKEEVILRGLSVIQFVISLMYFFLWSQTHTHLAIKKYERLKAQQETQGVHSQGAILKLLFLIPGVKNLYCLMQDGEFGSVFLFMFGSTMGMFYRIEWFSILLINFLMAKMDVLKSILQAMKASLPMLSMLSFFGASFIAFFSVFSLYYYVGAIYPEKLPKEHCESVYGCIVELYIKEEIGEDMDSFQGGRFGYDMIYVVFMDMLFGNIVGGVLIDNFASLRGEREEMLKDKTEKCFICGIDRETLEKRSLDLKTHYTHQYHKLWNYVFYLYYLEQQTKKTGLEEIIMKKYKEEDVSWIPLATSEESDIGDLLSRLEKLMKEQESTVRAIELKE